MHSPASNIDKDPYELSVTSEPSVGGGGGLKPKPYFVLTGWPNLLMQYLNSFLHHAYFLPLVFSQGYDMKSVMKPLLTVKKWWSNYDEIKGDERSEWKEVTLV